MSVWSDRLDVAGVSYALAEIAWVGLVNDPASPRGAQPLPAVAWRMANGQFASATPVDPPQAWQVLEALFVRRPDLRTAPPLQYGYAPGYAAPGYAPPGVAQKFNDNQTVIAGLAHLSIFFAPLIVPLILWLVSRGKAPYAAQQSKQAFFFHLGLWVIELVVLVPGMIIYFTGFFSFMETMPSYSTQPPTFPFASFGIVLILYVVVGAVQLVGIIFGIIGAVKAFQGQPFHYPLMGRV
jgi:uncharacterized Tic20 family protein